MKLYPVTLMYLHANLCNYIVYTYTYRYTTVPVTYMLCT